MQNRTAISIVAALASQLAACATDVDGPDETLGASPELEGPSEQSQALSDFDRYAVGVIPTDIHRTSANTTWGTQCPPGSELLSIYMDCEDDEPNSHFNWWTSPVQAVPNPGPGTDNHTLTFCKVDGRRFFPMTANSDQTRNYAVLKLGETCPNGSQEFWRYIDNEDDYNRNSVQGPRGPNVIDSNTRLFFCLFRSGSSRMTSFPNLGTPYAVFHDYQGSQPSWVIEKRIVWSDDEDDSNANSWGPQAPDFWAMINTPGPHGTTMFELARVR